MNDVTHPNRSDLRFDNFNHMWDEIRDYRNELQEHNDWLIQIPHTYDHKIIAYWGWIDTNQDVEELGTLGPLPFTLEAIL